MTEETMSVEDVKEASRNKFTVGIVGTGPAADALKYGFSKPRVETLQVDHVNFTIDDLIASDPHVVFFTDPSTVNEEGVTIYTETEDMILRVMAHTSAGAAIKTSLPIELVDRICARNKRIVYNPWPVTRTGTAGELSSLPVAILGGHPESTMALQEIYYRFSQFEISNMAHVSAVEAAFIEHSVNAILQLKSTFFNQLYDVVQEYGGDYHLIAMYTGADPRVGSSMTHVPSINLNRGCDMPRVNQAVKDLLKFNERFTVLKESDRMNETYLTRKDSK